jgi:hypothetical protein
MDLIYSRNFLIRAKELEECKEISSYLHGLDLTILTRCPPVAQPERSSKNWGKTSRQPRRQFVPPKREYKDFNKAENAWVPEILIEKTKRIPASDIKRMQGILNKLSGDNFDILVKETKTFDYTDPDVVGMIFKIAVGNPFFSPVYAKFCDNLTGLHTLIRTMCIKEFENNKHKNLCVFIGELYKLNLIDELHGFIDVLLTEINKVERDVESAQTNLEILCKIIEVVGVKESQFSDTIDDLFSNKGTWSARYRFMIEDIMDYKTGKRVPKKKEMKLKN